MNGAFLLFVRNGGAARCVEHQEQRDGSGDPSHSLGIN